MKKILIALYALSGCFMLLNGQVELPKYNFAGRELKKNNFTYCLNTENYDVIWTACVIHKDDIEEKRYIPSDSEFFPKSELLNTPKWKNLENQVKMWAMEYDSMYVITGVIYPSNDSSSTNQTAYYKVLLKGCQGDALGFILDLQNQNNPLKNSAVSVDKLEELTSMDFFSSLDPTLQEIIESDFDLNYWPISME